MAVDFCSKSAPYLEYQGDHWELVRIVNMQDYINPNWDESYNVSAYTGTRLEKVRANIHDIGLCSKLDSPWVRAFMQSYEDQHAVNHSSAGFLDTGLSSRLLYFSQQFQREPFDEREYINISEFYQIGLFF